MSHLEVIIMEEISWKNIPKPMHDSITYLVDTCKDTRKALNELKSLSEANSTMFSEGISELNSQISKLRSTYNTTESLSYQYFSTVDKLEVKLKDFRKMSSLRDMDNQKSFGSITSALKASELQLKKYTKSMLSHLEKTMKEYIDQKLVVVRSNQATTEK